MVNKYSQRQLQAMAEHLLREKERGTDKYLQFVLLVSAMSGKTTEYIEKMIRVYADD